MSTKQPFWSKITTPFRRLQWRLTFSYTLVTVGALVVVELLILAAIFFFANSDLLVETLVLSVRDSIVPQTVVYLEEEPPDLAGLASWTTTILDEPGTAEEPRLTRGLEIAFTDDQNIIILDPELRLLAQTKAVESAEIGQPFPVTAIESLPELVTAVQQEAEELDRFYRTLPGGTLLLALPIRSSDEGPLLGIFIMSQPLPALNAETLRPIILFLLISLIPITLVAGLIGTAFGFLTARGLSRRLGNLAETADAWSKGDFSAVTADRSGDELGQLARRLNVMAEQLQNLLQTRQELAGLEERNRLARDLHDSAKQQLFATVMQLAAAKALLPEQPEAAQHHLAEAEQLARQTQSELTGLIHELRPAELEGQGLSEAVRAYVTSWSRRSTIEGKVRVQGQRPLPLATEQALYRIIQEALANVQRHSEATAVALHLAWREGEFQLTIEDDGQGFDLDQLPVTGFGLHSMTERIERLGGQLQIDSQPGAGTRIKVHLPTKQEK